MLELRGVSFSAPGDNGRAGKEILRGVDLLVEDDSFAVITGPNGSGKSTLAKIIMGIERPTAGSVLLDGKDITNTDVTERAKMGIGFAFQQPVRFKGLTVRDLLGIAAGRTLDLEEACHFLVEVGLCANEYVERELTGSLSGGELKRIEIAMLLARATKVAVFDEPEAGIDLWSFHHLIRVFENIRNAHKGSVIIISHQERILDIADKIVILAEGKISNVGRKEDILPKILSDYATCQFYRDAL